MLWFDIMHLPKQSFKQAVYATQWRTFPGFCSSWWMNVGKQLMSVCRSDVHRDKWQGMTLAFSPR
jgi:hypothetical protein